MNPCFARVRGRGLLLLGAWLLASCASAPPPEPAHEIKRDALDRSAWLAFDLGQHDQAVVLYQQVLDEALREDDLEAIVEARYNLAASQMALGDYSQALEQISLAMADLRRRKAGWDPELTLLQATVLYRAGREREARTALVRLQHDGAGVTPTVRASALFLSGLMAAKAGEAGRLAAIIATMGEFTTDAANANRLELEAWLAQLQGSTAAALARFEELVDIRRGERDYRGMNRALVAAADLAEARSEVATAAGYLLRAGRSAARMRQPEARGWLQRAVRLGRRAGDSALVREAEMELAAPGGD